MSALAASSLLGYQMAEKQSWVQRVLVVVRTSGDVVGSPTVGATGG